MDAVSAWPEPFATPRPQIVAHRPVLVIDDDPAVREIVRDALEFDGYPVVTAEDGAAALAALEHVAPGVVLLDIRMPNMDGWEFSRRYRAVAGATAPLVLMTGDADAHRLCAEIGADACLSKPFHLAELYGLVAGYCGRASPPPAGGSRLSPRRATTAAAGA